MGVPSKTYIDTGTVKVRHEGTTFWPIVINMAARDTGNIVCVCINRRGFMDWCLSVAVRYYGNWANGCWGGRRA